MKLMAGICYDLGFLRSFCGDPSSISSVAVVTTHIITALVGHYGFGHRRGWDSRNIGGLPQRMELALPPSPSGGEDKAHG
jgi:hypothetical protein